MKNHIIIIMIALLNTFFLRIENSQAQSTSTGTQTGTPNRPITAGVDYLGWDNTVNVPLNIVHEADQPIIFFTNAGAGSLNNSKMTISRRTINNMEAPGITIPSFGVPIALPRSLLHLGADYLGAGIGGWRTWMDVGTFSGLQSDFAFFGIIPFDGDTMDNQDEHNDAAIVWGDNVDPANDGADNLRFIFSAPMNQTAGDWSTQYTSLEVGRFSPIGRMGIGNYTGTAVAGGSGIQPVRRFEIYDEHLNATLAAAPQMRLTFTPNANVNLGINTDFQTTANGNLILTPQNNGTVQNTGIGNFNVLGVQPSRRLELLDQGANLPQLRLTHTPNANPALGFWTDMQTTSTGNLKINSSNGLVGINSANIYNFGTINFFPNQLITLPPSQHPKNYCHTFVYDIS